MFLILVLTTAVGLVSTAELPSFLMRCSKNDPDLNACFQRAANDAIPKLKGGVPALGVPPMDPLLIPKIAVKDTSNGKFSMNLLFENVKFSNISNSRITTRLDLKNLLLSGKFFIPHTKMESDYQVDGKLLVVPIKGKGKAKIDIWGSRADFILKVKPKDINGLTYYTPDSLQYSIQGVDSVKIRLSNILGTHRALGESLNDVLNDNWRDLFDSVRPSFNEVLRNYFLTLGKRVFNKVPIQDIFPEKV